MGRLNVGVCAGIFDVALLWHIRIADEEEVDAVPHVADVSPFLAALRVAGASVDDRC